MTDIDNRIKQAEKNMEELRRMRDELLNSGKLNEHGRTTLGSFFFGIVTIAMLGLGCWKVVELVIELIKYFRG